MSKRLQKKRQRRVARMTHAEKVRAATKEMRAADVSVKVADRRRSKAVQQLAKLYEAGSHVEIDTGGSDNVTVEVPNPRTGEIATVTIHKETEEERLLDASLDAGLMDADGKPNAPCIHGRPPGQPCPHCMGLKEDR